ncbi:helix-turn-helix domain-containing protein [Secundilactobacillus paracollinoides]
MLNVSPRTVSSWESGKSNPTGSAKRLLQLLDEDPKALHSVIDF